jgi:hypothetical protein
MGTIIMILTDLQHQLAQTAETTSTLFVFTPILVMIIPLLLLYLSLRSLGKSFSWFGSLYHGLTKQ